MRRFEALTGGDEFGAGRFGVSAGFDLGNRIFAGGGLGVSTGGGGSSNTLDCTTGAEVTGGLAFGLTAFAGVLGSVTSDDCTGIWSGSDEMVMTLDTGGMRVCGARAPFASAVLAHNGVVLFGGDSSPSTGLEALHPPGRCATFCLFGALSSSNSFSFSFLASYGDFIGCAFPTGPFGVPRRVFSDL